MKGEKSVPVAFAAIDPYIEKNIIEPTEKIVSGRDYVEWGDRNGYPDYLFDLYKGSPTLRSVVDGSVDYVCGNGVEVAFHPQGDYMNREGMTAAAFIRDLALSFWLYGGFAIEVIRDHGGDVAELYPRDLRYLRSSKDNAVFWYSEEWQKGTSSVKTVVRPRFMEEARGVGASIFYEKNLSMQTYPLPIYSDSVPYCEIERALGSFNLNSVHNGFSGSTIIDFPGPAPEDEQKREIEKDVNEKFAGPGNAGRTLLIWGDGGSRAVGVRQLEAKDMASKYDTLVKNSKQMIFTAFRANPNLFGIPTEKLGFSSEEYQSTFDLYNRTQIKPVQQRICEAVGKIFGDPNYMTINPFTLE